MTISALAPQPMTSSAQIAAELPLQTDLFIDGKFVPAASGARFDCISPRDGQVAVTVAEGGAADIDAAVAAARRSFESGVWRDMHPRERRVRLQRLAALVAEHRDTLARIESLDMGKPLAHARAVDLRVTLQTIEFYAEIADKLYDQVAPTGPDALATITREPLGVVGAVVPWNFPLMLAAWKFAPALAVGNSVVMKPAEQSPLSLLFLARLAAEAGIPDGVFNVVPGFGPTAGATLGRHMDVDAITFTGSGPVGRMFLEYSAQSNLKEVSLELGGKSAQVIFADAGDIEQVARSVATGIFFNAGEVCAAGSRVVVERSIQDELVQAVVQQCANWTPADPMDEDTVHGALVEEEHMDRVLGHIDNARADGAQLRAGGNRVLEQTGGFYVEPTVFADVDPSSRLATEEVFGPVLAVMPFDTQEQAVALANGTDFGLAASVWTRDISRAHKTARRLQAGTVWVNNYDDSDITVPFGGAKQSGFGGHDKSLEAIDKYCHTKSTWIAL